MNGIVQKVVCFFALLLVMSIGSVAHAQQQSYYVYEHTYSESAKSKTVAAVQQHDLLVLQNGKLAYEYDMLRINKDGINEQKQLPRGVAEIVTYSENAYVVFYNEKAQQLEVYDENLQLIDTEQVTMSSKTNG